MNSSQHETITAYIGLGSNLDSPIQHIKLARQAIADLNQVYELAFSSLYQSEPMGPQNQPDYINAVMAIATDLPALELLHCLQAIEHHQGRVRAERWGARTLDLDILLYGHQQIESAELTVPHVGIAERAFVLHPLFEIAPQLTLPCCGALADLIGNCPATGLTRLS